MLRCIEFSDWNFFFVDYDWNAKKIQNNWRRSKVNCLHSTLGGFYTSGLLEKGNNWAWWLEEILQRQWFWDWAVITLIFASCFEKKIPSRCYFRIILSNTQSFGIRIIPKICWRNEQVKLKIVFEKKQNGGRSYEKIESW